MSWSWSESGPSRRRRPAGGLPYLGSFRWDRRELSRLPARVAELAAGSAPGRLAVDLGPGEVVWGEIRYDGLGGWELESADGSVRESGRA